MPREQEGANDAAGSLPASPTKLKSALRRTSGIKSTIRRKSSKTGADQTQTRRSKSGDECRVVVGCRARPLNATEIELGNKEVWKTTSKSISNIVDKNAEGSGSKNRARTYFYDYVFKPDTTTANVFDKMGKPIIDSALEGYNGTIFAYGQTSSGKTHTLMGDTNDPGIIILAIHEVFDHIHNSPDIEFLVRVSYVEIYNENIKDLFDTSKDNKNKKKGGLKIMDDPVRGPYVKDLKEVIVLSPEHVLELIKTGEEQRHFASTNMNARSSRSHTLFRMVLESRSVAVATAEDDNDSQGSGSATGIVGEWDGSVNKGSVRVSTLNLIDLAGSERVSKTGAEGIRLKEGSMINMSLLTLGTVIYKLSEGGRGHIPFRDSKLTRLLSSSLGGNAKTAVVCTVSLASRNADETKSTLDFASRAKKVVNKAIKNEVTDHSALLDQYKNEIEELKRRLNEGQSIVSAPQLVDLKADLKAEQKKRIETEKKLQAKVEHHQEDKRKLGDLQQFIHVASKLASTNPDLRHIIAEQIIEVGMGRRRADSVLEQNQKLLKKKSEGFKGRRARKMSKSATQNLDAITALRKKLESAVADGVDTISEDGELDSEEESDSDSASIIKVVQLSKERDDALKQVEDHKTAIADAHDQIRRHRESVDFAKAHIHEVVKQQLALAHRHKMRERQLSEHADELEKHKHEVKRKRVHLELQKSAVISALEKYQVLKADHDVLTAMLEEQSTELAKAREELDELCNVKELATLREAKSGLESKVAQLASDLQASEHASGNFEMDLKKDKNRAFISTSSKRGYKTYAKGKRGQGERPHARTRRREVTATKGGG